MHKREPMIMPTTTHGRVNLAIHEALIKLPSFIFNTTYKPIILRRL